MRMVLASTNFLTFFPGDDWPSPHVELDSSYTKTSWSWFLLLRPPRLGRLRRTGPTWSVRTRRPGAPGGPRFPAGDLRSRRRDLSGTAIDAAPYM